LSYGLLDGITVNVMLSTGADGDDQEVFSLGGYVIVTGGADVCRIVVGVGSSVLKLVSEVGVSGNLEGIFVGS
jgi:hypothetical protein